MTDLPRRLARPSAVALSSGLAAAPLAAQTGSGGGMSRGAGHDMGTSGMAGHQAGSAYSDAMDTMMQAMEASEPTGDSDR